MVKFNQFLQTHWVAITLALFGMAMVMHPSPTLSKAGLVIWGIASEKFFSKLKKA